MHSKDKEWYSAVLTKAITGTSDLPTATIPSLVRKVINALDSIPESETERTEPREWTTTLIRNAILGTPDVPKATIPSLVRRITDVLSPSQTYLRGDYDGRTE